MESARKYFEQHSEARAVHATSDGFLFSQYQHAFNHSVTLVDQEIETYKRDSFGENAQEKKEVSPMLAQLLEKVRTGFEAKAAAWAAANPENSTIEPVVPKVNKTANPDTSKVKKETASKKLTVIKTEVSETKTEQPPVTKEPASTEETNNNTDQTVSNEE